MMTRFNIIDTVSICKICNTEFVGKHNAKYCSDECRYEAWKIYMRKTMRKKRLHNQLKNGNITIEEVEKIISNSTKKITMVELKRLLRLAKRQQYIHMINMDNCCVCETTTGLILHHVKYYPKPEVKILCRSCHGILHNRLLKRKKCKPVKVKN